MKTQTWPLSVHAQIFFMIRRRCSKHLLTQLQKCPSPTALLNSWIGWCHTQLESLVSPNFAVLYWSHFQQTVKKLLHIYSMEEISTSAGLHPFRKKAFDIFVPCSSRKWMHRWAGRVYSSPESHLRRLRATRLIVLRLLTCMRPSPLSIIYQNYSFPLRPQQMLVSSENM